jgi:acetyl esterase/lipase
MKRLLLAMLPLLPLVFAGCGAAKGLAIRVLMDEAALPAAQVELDVHYYEGEGDDARKHRLDLFLPSGPPGWPLLVFVHGGSWTHGDKGLAYGGFDVYGNIGRFYAGQGIGVAVINYRLQAAGITWREQALDVARAVTWVQRHAGDYGGDGRRVFLAGHSAGAHLIAYVGLVEWPLAQAGGDRAALCGVVAVSGAGFDLADEETYRLGASREFYRRRFQAGQADGLWQREASATTDLAAGSKAPPFLFFYSDAEWPSLHHQNVLLARRLDAAGIVQRTVVVPKLSHARMALAISDPKRPVVEPLLAFLRAPCPAP